MAYIQICTEYALEAITMEDIDKLFDKAVAEVERMLNTKTVVGEPITVEGNTQPGKD